MGVFTERISCMTLYKTGCVDGEYLNVVDKGERLGVSLLYRYAKSGTLKSIVCCTKPKGCEKLVSASKVISRWMFKKKNNDRID